MNIQRCGRAAIGLAAALAAGLLAAAPLKIDLPPPTTTLKSGAGSELAQGYCVTCHSTDYIATQPSGKPRAFWKAEVEKMKKVYGAAIPDDKIDPIADYLTKSYGNAQAK